MDTATAPDNPATLIHGDVLPKSDATLEILEAMIDDGATVVAGGGATGLIPGTGIPFVYRNSCTPQYVSDAICHDTLIT